MIPGLIIDLLTPTTLSDSWCCITPVLILFIGDHITDMEVADAEQLN